jgi:pimeloyl-ACP methyl ester carboxylesterase
VSKNRLTQRTESNIMEPFERGRIGPLDVRVYRITTEDDVELAVTRLGSDAEGPTGEPVILVHGTFCQRSFWVSDKGLGLGPYLCQRGYDVWIPEARGHGRSPRDERYRNWSAEDQMRFDLPAVQRFVAKETGRGAQWVGHSWGGVAIIGSIGGEWLTNAQMKSAVVLGANITEGDAWMKRPLPRALAWGLLTVLGRVPAGLFGLGPEPESRSYMLDFFRWKGPNAQWRTGDGRDYWDGIGRTTVPLLAFAAANDTMDPVPGCRFLFDAVGSDEKEWVLLGTEQGFSKDYGHVEMIISRAASKEVWPRIADWLGAHA